MKETIKLLGRGVAKVSRLLLGVLFLAIAAGRVLADPTGTIVIQANNACGSGASFTFQYTDTSGNTITTNATTPATFQPLAKRSTYIVYNIQPFFNGSQYVGALGLTNTVPANGFTVTNVLALTYSSATTNLLSSSLNPSSYGQSVTFTDRVVNLATCGNTGTPSGEVIFFDGATILGTNVLNASGIATLTTTNLTACGSPHSIMVAFDDLHTGTNFAPSTNTLIQAVNKAGSVASITSSLNPAPAGQPVTFTAKVFAVSPGFGIPTGTIQFKTNGVNFGSAVTLSGGTANSINFTNVSTCALTVVAVYNGDCNFTNSTSTNLQQSLPDSIPPYISCPADVTVNAALGLCYATNVTLGNAIATDNCLTPTVKSNVPAQYSVGTNNVIWTATDAAGNTSTCLQKVIVLDTQPPVINCPSNITVNASNGVCHAVVNFTVTYSDNCAVTNVTSVPASGHIFPVGTTTVTNTATDSSGNQTTCTFTVTVIDNQPPTLACPADVTVLPDAGTNVATDVSLGSPIVSDNCGLNGVTNNALSAFPLGTNFVIWTATDIHGNTASCQQMVVVGSTIPPGITCPADVTVPASLDLCVATNVTLGSPVTSSSCGSVTVTNNAPASFPVGTNFVVWTALDQCSHATTCSQMVVVLDTQAPTITCPTNVSVSSSPGLCSSTNVVLGTPIVNDNCAVALVTNNAASQTTFPVGTNTVVWMVADASGNTATCSQQVIVSDTEPPTITCPADVSVVSSPGLCSSTNVVLGTPTVSDNCGVAGVTNDAVSQTTFNVGTNTVTWTVTDLSGNTATCSQQVIVSDTEPPSITCPTDVSVVSSPGLCSSTNVVLGTPTVGDNCGVAGVTNDAVSQTTFPVGTNVVTWTVTDLSGNASTCTQLVIVSDTEPPTITCPTDVSVVSSPGLCASTNVVLGLPAVSDNCGVATVVNNAASQTTFPVGTNTVIWTVTDLSGNASTCAQMVIVMDTEPPSITCPTNVSVVSSPGLCSSTNVVLGTPAVGDNCGVAGVTNDAVSQTTFNVGTNTVTWTVTDLSGNTATCAQLVIVADTEAPTITCPADVSVVSSPGLCASTNVVLGTPITTDNCGVAGVTNDAVSQNIFNVGTNTVTWTVTDLSGNTATCAQLVIVSDTEAPTITCPADVSVVSSPGLCSSTNVVLGTPNTGDNCGVASVVNNAVSQTTFPVGTNTVIWTVTDLSGNTATCAQMVIVSDTEPPTITCPTNVYTIASPGLCTATNVALGATITGDNCGVASLVNNAVSQTTFPVGTNTVVWTVTDLSGNTATCAQLVIVADTQAPSITCPADVSILPDAGTNVATHVNLGTPTTSDNCGVYSVVSNAPAVFPLGTNVVTWTVADLSGNTASCSQQVVVGSTLPPSITCPADVTVPASLGLCAATNVALGTPTTSSTCGSVTVSNNAPASIPVGTNIVIWTVFDQCTHSATCAQQVIVLDTQPPSIICPADVSAQPATNSSFAYNVVLGTPTVSDNCAVAAVTNNAASQTVFPIGTNLVTWTVTDLSGNTATCVQQVIVPGIPPVIVTQPVSETNNVGTVATFSVAATGTAPLSYLWSFDGTPIPGATSTAYTIFDVQTTNAGTYTVTVTNLYGSVTSSNAILVVTVSSCLTQPAGLVSWWRAENNGLDSAGTNNGTLTNMTFAPGEVGQAFNFNGTNTYVDVPASPSLNVGLGAGFTVEAWINPSNINHPDPIVEWNNGLFGVNFSLSDVNSRGPGSLWIDVKDTSLTDHVFSSPAGLIGTNDWYHVAVTYNQSSGFTVLYINGSAVTQSNLPSVTPRTIGDMYFGTRLFDGGAGTHFAGLMDEVSLYNRALSAAEILAIYNNGAGGKCVTKPPFISTNADFIVANSTGICANTNVTLTPPTSSSVCPTAVVTSSVVFPATFNTGTNVVIWTASDNCGNTASSAQRVIVQDTQAPGIICPADVLAQPATNSVFAYNVVLGTPTVSDNCGVARVTNNAPSQTVFQIGTNLVTWTVTDTSGNTATCSQRVVVPGIPPVIVVQPVSETNNVGTIATFTVTATGTAPLSYLWSFDGTPIPGATSTTYTIFDVQTTNAGTYTVTVTNLYGTVTSSNAILVVTMPSCLASLPGPISWWRAENNALDSVGTNNGTLINTVTYAPGVVGQAFVFNGPSNAVMVPDSQSLRLTNELTLEAWINTTTTNPPGFDQAIMSKIGGVGANNGYQMGLHNNQLFGQFNSPGTPWPSQRALSGALPIGLGTWNHIAYTYDQSAIRLYFNGQLVASNYVGPHVITATNSTFRLSGDDNLHGYFYGMIDEAEVYNVALTDAQILAIYNNGSGGKCVTKPPFISTNADFIVADSTGICAATNVTLTPPTSSSVCPTAVVTSSVVFPATFNTGTNVVIWTALDGCGNTATSAQNVIVRDTQAPFISCPTDVNAVSSLGLCTATNVTLGTPATSDNCGVASVTNNAVSQTTFAVGTNTVVWTVTDVNGNTATCSQRVVVRDTQPPTITCPADVNVVASPGLCVATNVSLGASTVGDNCGVGGITNNAPSQTTFPVGTNIVVWTAVDANGNTASCSQRVIVRDTQAPSITCPADVIQLASLGLCNATNVVLGTPVTSDNCGVASVTNNAGSQTVFPVGTNLVTWTVRDVNGNTATCSQRVIISDTQAPSITCPSDVNVSASLGLCSATNVVLGTPLTTDNCGVASVTNNAPSQKVFPTGTNLVTWIVTDLSGNTATCSQRVIVRNTQAPIIVCPTNLVVATDPGQCSKSNVTFTVIATNGCGSVPVTSFPPSGSTFNVGTTTVTNIAVDGNGNTNTCTFTVTVNYSSSGNPETGNIVLMGIDAEDGTVRVSQHGPILTWCLLGSNILRSASSGNGILVLGGGKSNLLSDDVSLFWKAVAATNHQPLTFINGSNNIMNASFDGYKMIGIPSDIGQTPSGGLTWDENDALALRAYDLANFINGGHALWGLLSQFDARTNVGPYAYLAGIGGVKVGQQDYSVVYPTAAGTALGINATLNVSSWHEYFTNYPSFLKILATVPISGVSWPAALGGNVNVPQFSLTCPNPTTVQCTGSLTVTGQVFNTACQTLAVTWKVDGVTVTTNTITPFSANTLVPFTYNYTNAGVHQLVMTASDGFSFPSCTTTVTVNGSKPSINCPNSLVLSADAGKCSKSNVTFTVTATNGCGGGAVTVTSHPASGSTFAVGTTVVTNVASDGLGNSNVCTFTVTVNDTEPPVITTPGNIVLPTSAGTCGRTNVTFSVTATDNCGLASLVNTPPSGSTFRVGTNTVTSVATDIHGNTSTNTFSVVITDTEKPVVLCPVNLVFNVDPGTCSKSNVTFNASAMDNCGVASVVSTPPSGSTFPVGTTTVTTVATDTSGNTNVCTFTVTVNKLVVPTPSLTISVDGSGQIQLYWPTNAPGFHVQTTSVLGAAAVWLDDPTVPTVVGSQYNADMGTPTDMQFYRLVTSDDCVSAQPVLGIQLVAGQIQVFWVTDVSGFHLQSSPVLGTTAAWSNVINPPAVSGTTYTVTLNPTQGTQFFRLVYP